MSVTFKAILWKLTFSACCLWFTEISIQGEKYLDRQIENAINGVKEMKSVMQKSSEEHKRFLDDLEKTEQKKEVALILSTICFNSIFVGDALGE